MSGDSYIRNPTTGDEVASLDGSFRFSGSVDVEGSLTQNGQPVGGVVSLETPSGAVNGSNRIFTFTAAPKMVFRNGVQETRLGVIVGNVFTFNVAPDTSDDIEGLI